MEKTGEDLWKFDRDRVNRAVSTKIPLRIDNYNDIFSVFDARPFVSKALSDDFLTELRRASRDKAAGEIEIELSSPKARRNARDEATIKRRLLEHFKKHHEMLAKDKNSMIKRGITFAAMGILLMLAATYVLFEFAQNSFLTSFLVVLLEPGGWFFFWEGLYLIILEPETKRIIRELEFYRKMSLAKIEFISY